MHVPFRVYVAPSRLLMEPLHALLPEQAFGAPQMVRPPGWPICPSQATPGVAGSLPKQYDAPARICAQLRSETCSSGMVQAPWGGSHVQEQVAGIAVTPAPPR